MSLVVEPAPPGRWTRRLVPGQRCRIVVFDLSTGVGTIVHEDRSVLFEAPNWTRDGRLILNGDGSLWSVETRPGAEPVPVPITGVTDLNNDHVLAPDGEHIYVSAFDWHIWSAPLAGGAARRITADDGRMHFLHGVSPSGDQLAYTAVLPAPDLLGSPGTIRQIRSDGTDDVDVVSGPRPSDGSEYDPEGSWLYFNTELFTSVPGHAQIARVRPDGTALERLTWSDRVDWFPHLSPDGSRCVYLSYPTGTVGHPADLDVELRLVEHDEWSSPRTLVRLAGGQGTINVNSWSPDGTRFAYVDYPVDGEPAA